MWPIGYWEAIGGGLLGRLLAGLLGCPLGKGGGVSEKSDSVGGFGKKPLFQKWSEGGF